MRINEGIDQSAIEVAFRENMGKKSWSAHWENNLTYWVHSQDVNHRVPRCSGVVVSFTIILNRGFNEIIWAMRTA